MLIYASHCSRQSLRNFKPFLALCADWPFVNGGTANIRAVHSLQKFKSRTPTYRINERAKKNNKLVEKDVDPKVYTRDTIRNISNLLRYSTWDSAQEQLEKLSIRWDSYTINQVLKTHPPMEKAWLFFNWASQLRGFKHDQFTYTTMLDIFGEARRISSMNHVFQQMQEKEIKIDAVTYTSLMHWLSNDGDVDGSVKIWKDLKSKGCHPTVVSYTAYMKVLFDHSRIKEATEVYKEMIQAGCSPNCYTYTVLMEHLAASGKFNEVLEIFSKMQEAGVKPDKAACNILVEKCCESGETWALSKILQYMKENALVLRYPVFVAAHETLKNARESNALLKHVNPHLSIECVNEEAKDDSDVTSSETQLIDQEILLNFLKRKNFVAVDRLLVDMMKKNKQLQLHSDIISTIVEVYSVHCRLEGSLMAFEYSVKMGVTLKKRAYLSLIGVFVRTNSFPKVVEIVEEMVRTGVSLGTHLSALLIYRLGCARRHVSARSVFHLLPDEQKNTSAYTALIGAYFFSGKTSKALETFETMRMEGIPVALGTYNVLISGLEKSGRDLEIESYRKERKNLQATTLYHHQVPEEEKICNLLFAGDMVS